MQSTKGEGDTARLRDFVNQMVEELENRSIGVYKIWFSDETHFQLNDYLNKQNWRHWVTENPHLRIIMKLHPQRIMVWCAINGPIFIDSMIIGVKYQELLQH